MRKLSITVLALFFSLASLAPVFAEERTFPQSDFFLYLGVRNPAAGLSAGRIERILFSSAHADVKTGKIVSDRMVPISFTQGVQEFNGNASIKMDGEYDQSDGRLSGTFTMIVDMKDVWHGDVADVPSNWIETTNGIFTGQVVEENVVLHYKGKTNVDAHNGMADGSVKNWSEVNDYSAVVVWRLSEYKAPVVPKVSDLDKEFLNKYGKAEDSGARFYRPNGQIEIHIPGEPEDSWHIVDPLTAIPYGAQIKTDEDSEATITFADRSSLTMKPESTIIISGPPEERSKWKLVGGNIWVNIKKMIKDGSMEIDLNQAVAGIKGTAFVASVQGDKSTFKVLEGKLSVRAKTGSETIDLIGGQEATIDASGKIIKDNFDILAEQDTWDHPEKIDFAALERLVSSAPVVPGVVSPKTEPEGQNMNSANTAKSEGDRQILLIAVFGGVLLIGGIVAVIYRKRKQLM